MTPSATTAETLLGPPRTADRPAADGAPADATRFLEALRPGVMGPRLAAAFGGPSDRCHVLDAKYEAGVRAIVLYEYDGQLVRGDLDVAAGIRLSRFPADPELPRLPEVMDPDRLAAELYREIGPARPRGAAIMPRGRVTLLRYRPGKRATVLFRNRTAPGGAWVVKAYHDPVKAAAVAREAERLADTSRTADRLRLAPYVGHVADLGLVVHGPVTGTPLDVLLHERGPVGSGPTRHAVATAGTALAEFHNLAPATQRQRPVEKELRRFLSRAEGSRTLDPVFADAAAALAHRLIEAAETLSPATYGVVHGDCKPSQFLLDGRRAFLLDLDHCGIADPAADVGTFLASLRQLAVRRALSSRPGRFGQDRPALADAFLRAYVDRSAHAVGRDRVRWQEAVALERKALRAFARAPLSPLGPALVREGHRCLDERGTAG